MTQLDQLTNFRRKVEEFNANLRVRVTCLGAGAEEHWRIVGGSAVVSYWPFSHRRTAFCEATKQTYRAPSHDLLMKLTTHKSKAQKPKIRCPYCDKRMILRKDSKYTSHGLWYACPDWPTCKGAHGAHPDGQPVGTPATADTSELRIQAHDAFDLLWKPHKRKRGDAYRFLVAALNISVEDCHIGSFDQAMCTKVIAVCTALTPEEREDVSKVDIKSLLERTKEPDNPGRISRWQDFLKKANFWLASWWK